MKAEVKSWGRALCLLFTVSCIAVCLSGCAVVRYLVIRDWNGDADLVVVSQNPTPIASIALEQENASRVMADAGGLALLERGESYGLKLDEGEEDCTIVFLDLDEQELGQAQIHFEGTRLYLTLWEGGSVTVSEENK